MANGIESLLRSPLELPPHRLQDSPSPGSPGAAGLEPGPPPASTRLPASRSLSGPAALNAGCTFTSTRAFCVPRSGFSRKRGGQSSGLRMFTRKRACDHHAGKGGAEAGWEEGAASLPVAGNQGPSRVVRDRGGHLPAAEAMPNGAASTARTAPGTANPSSKAVRVS